MYLFKTLCISILLIGSCSQASYVRAEQQVVILNIQGVDNFDKYTRFIEIIENMDSIESFIIFTISNNALHIEVTLLSSYNNILDEILEQEKFTIIKESVKGSLVHLEMLLL